MTVRNFIVFCVLIFSAMDLPAGIWDNVTSYLKGPQRENPPTIRVLVLHDVPGADLEVKGKHFIVDPNTGEQLGNKRYVGKKRHIEVLSSGMKWGEEFPYRYQIQITPLESALIALDEKEYDGSISAYEIEKGKGRISFVNEVPIEDYLLSVLNGYQDQNLEPETLAALAIAARTTAYTQVMNPKSKFWAVDAQKVGFGGKVFASTQVKEAVRQTRNMIMSKTGVYEGSATPFPALFGHLQGDELPKHAIISKITLDEANAMAKNGSHAAQILSKAFPGTTIMLIQK